MKFRYTLQRYLNMWTFLTAIIIMLILLPNLSILLNFFTEKAENWNHIREHILPELLKNTSILLVSVGFLTILFGTSLAWIVAAYQFPLRNFFRWALILPLSIPPYIAAYTFNGMLNYTGVVQVTLRNKFDIVLQPDRLDIMTMPGAIFIFTLFLYPYVYLVTRVFLHNQTATLVENARLLGSGAIGVFFRIVMPISRAAIVGGVTLVLLEVLNDYGVVQYFGIPTFTTAIFQTWYGLGDLNAAIKLSATLMFIVFGLLLLEKAMRGRRRYSYSVAKAKKLSPIRLRGLKAAIATLYCFIFFGIGFLIPFIQLIDWMVLTWEKIANPEFKSLVMNSVLVASVGAALITIFALIVVNFSRMHPSPVPRIAARTTLLGYSIPGTVIAVGTITVFLAIDQLLFSFYEMAGLEPKLLLSTSLMLLIAAYTIRFLAVGFNSVEAGFEESGNKYMEASRTLGAGVTETFFRVDFPIIKRAVGGGFILAFIEILKELPLTLVLRPFNFNTLSTKTFQYASDEQIHEASLPSLLIIAISAIAIYVTYNLLEKEK
ncbi:iron ABC transporter permease [Aciduricibacillus chroicocephali]|uniref:Iron ABC transporter permease n=1 Tax=Aciduricibacillus chroicocephali TaxID=3054939 RepID=A0ABY9KTN5_9BACI|nr:iron ABC transporter permease [Bacillaceae bacterium 44XB]